MQWHPDNGPAINLLDPSADGVMLVQDGVRGLSMPPVQRYSSTSPAVHGSRNRGHRVEEREVFWPLLVWTRDGTDAWMRLDSRLWDGLRPDVEGWWVVETAWSGRRRLRCRFADDGDHSFGRDPSRSGWALYGVRLVAEQPFWTSESTPIEWDQGAPAEFFPGPPFRISGSRRMDSATLRNPGDVHAWPVWTINGPCSSATVGVGGRQVVVPFAVASGERLVIDTRPEHMTATLVTAAGAEVDRTADLGAATEFAPVPAGGTVDLSLTAPGGGRVTADMTALYYRAWGPRD